MDQNNNMNSNHNHLFIVFVPESTFLSNLKHEYEETLEKENKKTSKDKDIYSTTVVSTTRFSYVNSNKLSTDTPYIQTTEETDQSSKESKKFDFNSNIQLKGLAFHYCKYCFCLLITGKIQDQIKSDKDLDFCYFPVNSDILSKSTIKNSPQNKFAQRTSIDFKIDIKNMDNNNNLSLKNNNKSLNFNCSQSNALKSIPIEPKQEVIKESYKKKSVHEKGRKNMSYCDFVKKLQHKVTVVRNLIHFESDKSFCINELFCFQTVYMSLVDEIKINKILYKKKPKVSEFYLANRKKLVTNLFILVKEYKYHIKIYFFSLFIMDYFFINGNYDESLDDPNYFLIASFLIAVKFIENDAFTPSSEHIQVNNSKLDPINISKAEVCVLDINQYKLDFIDAYQFLQWYFVLGVAYENEVSKIPNFDKLVKDKVIKLSEKLLMLLTFENEWVNYSPNDISLAILMLVKRIIFELKETKITIYDTKSSKKTEIVQDEDLTELLTMEILNDSNIMMQYFLDCELNFKCFKVIEQFYLNNIKNFRYY